MRNQLALNPRSSVSNAQHCVETESLKRISTEELFEGVSKHLVIEHAGAEYRLRITRQNKLILTK